MMMMITSSFFCQAIVMVIKQCVKTCSFYFEIIVWNMLFVREIVSFSSNLKFDNDTQQ